MAMWRSISVLLVWSGAVGCATATNGGPLGGNDFGGTDSGGSTTAQGGATVAGSDSGGAPSAGAPNGGAPAGGSGNAGSPSGGAKPSGGASSGGASSGGAAGSVGAAGKGGASSGGSAGGGGGVTAGAGGGTSSGPCAAPKDVKGGNSGSLGTKAAVCLRTTDKFNTLTCSNWDGRTIKVNGVLAMCGVKTTFAPMIDGYNYFDVSAGTAEFASFVWYSS